MTDDLPGYKQPSKPMDKEEYKMDAPVPMLIISGSMGSGKTTMMSEVSDVLVEANVAHAAIDLDALSIVHPLHGQRRERLMFTNLAAIWPIYAAAGAGRIVVARVVEDRSELRQYREAVPGAEAVVCRLTASIETMQERVRIRDPGMIQAEAVARVALLADILDRKRAEDFSVYNGEGRPITDAAHEVLVRTGWL